MRTAHCFVVEDAAESLGAKYKLGGKWAETGSLGDYNCIPFNGNKIITGSSGGMLLTDSKEDADKVRKWSTQSREDAPWYQHEEIGYNYRMSNVKVSNVSFPALNMIWIMPEKQEADSTRMEAGTITVSVTPQKAESVRDALFALQALRDFSKGDLRINGTRMGRDISGSAAGLDNKQLDAAICFWTEMQSLEALLNIRFDPGADCPEADMKFAAELAASLLDKKDLSIRGRSTIFISAQRS